MTFQPYLSLALSAATIVALVFVLVAQQRGKSAALWASLFSVVFQLLLFANMFVNSPPKDLSAYGLIGIAFTTGLTVMNYFWTVKIL